MTQVRNLLLGTTAFIAISTAAFAQTPAAPGADAGQMSAQVQGAPGVTPPPQNLVAPAPTDPLVQKRNANAQANAEYKASKKASKDARNAANKQAKAQYKEEVSNAKINRKADKQAATAELKAAEPNGPDHPTLEH
jgi:hypothetical protein